MVIAATSQCLQRQPLFPLQIIKSKLEHTAKNIWSIVLFEILVFLTAKM